MHCVRVIFFFQCYHNCRVIINNATPIPITSTHKGMKELHLSLFVQLLVYGQETTSRPSNGR